MLPTLPAPKGKGEKPGKTTGRTTIGQEPVYISSTYDGRILGNHAGCQPAGRFLSVCELKRAEHLRNQANAFIILLLIAYMSGWRKAVRRDGCGRWVVYGIRHTNREAQTKRKRGSSKSDDVAGGGGVGAPAGNGNGERSKSDDVAGGGGVGAPAGNGNGERIQMRENKVGIHISSTIRQTSGHISTIFMRENKVGIHISSTIRQTSGHISTIFH
ncbi:hypothetical protein QE152_g5874 [Popillia japonica]|uniref:Uncharacterized protein n=1 Tax=Popillia japonica TaxID=7064 RepID=A0AAW1MML9_POPJA